MRIVVAVAVDQDVVADKLKLDKTKEESLNSLPFIICILIFYECRSFLCAGTYNLDFTG